MAKRIDLDGNEYETEQYWRFCNMDESNEEIFTKDRCICSDGPFHYSNCPQYSKGCNDSFAKFGAGLSGRNNL